MTLREMADKLSEAKSLIQEVMDDWQIVPDDVDVSSGQQAVKFVGMVERDLDDAADEAFS